jgi:hypothetical protein
MKLYISNIYAENLSAMLQDFPAGISAAVSSVLAFLTMPFKGTQMNSLKVGK